MTSELPGYGSYHNHYGKCTVEIHSLGRWCPCIIIIVLIIIAIIIILMFGTVTLMGLLIHARLTSRRVWSSVVGKNFFSTFLLIIINRFYRATWSYCFYFYYYSRASLSDLYCELFKDPFRSGNYSALCWWLPRIASRHRW